MKRILYIGNPMSIHDLKWINYLNNSGEVDVYFSFDKILSDDELKSLSDQKIKLGPQLLPFRLLNWVQNFRTLFRLKKFISENQIDCIHIFIGSSQIIVPSMLNISTVLTTRGTDVNYTLKELFKASGFKDKILFSILKKAYYRIDQITCTSNTQIVAIKVVLGDLKSKPELIRTGVDLEALQEVPFYQFSTKNKASKTVLFIRNIHKNYDPLLSVSGIVLMNEKVRDDTHFVFMKGLNYTVALFEEMKLILDQNKINYTFIDAVPNNDVWGLIKVADLVVMNPLSDGTPNTAIEAMGAKTSLIMGYCDYDSDLFNPSTTMFLSKRDPEELAQKMTKQLLHVNNEVLENAFNVVWEKGRQSVEMKKVIALYNKLA